jgi:hypothetical protein
LPYYAAVTHLHLEVSVFQKNPTSSLLVEVVLVGKTIVEDSNEAPHVSAIAVVPVIDMRRVAPSAGVPVKLVVNEVIAVLCPVM